MHSRLRRPRGLYRLNRSFNFTSNEKEPITRRFLSGYRLCVCASGSVITSIFSCDTSISVSRQHFGQYSGKFRSTVSGRICNRVLFRHTGHIIQLLSGIAEPAPHMPELEAACRKAANRVGEHEADRKQRQRYQRRGTQLTFFLRRKLRCDRKRGQQS